MPRPSTWRTERIEARITPEESAALLARAEEAGFASVSAYVRTQLLDGITAPAKRRAVSADSAALIRMLTRVGERLHFLLALSRGYPAIHEELAACHAVVCQTIAELPS